MDFDAAAAVASTRGVTLEQKYVSSVSDLLDTVNDVPMSIQVFRLDNESEGKGVYHQVTIRRADGDEPMFRITNLYGKGGIDSFTPSDLRGYFRADEDRPRARIVMHRSGEYVIVARPK